MSLKSKLYGLTGSLTALFDLSENRNIEANSMTYNFAALTV